MEIKGSTRIAIVIGHPIKHSMSPVMHNRAFRHLNMDCSYIALDIKPEGVEYFVKGLRYTNILGVNVTIPHKTAVIPYLDELSEEASFLKAVNTIKINEDKLIGYNTDVYGFEKCLEGIDVASSSALLIGAGGAGKAVAYTLCKLNIKRLFITNRTEEKAKDLIRSLTNLFKGEISFIPFGKLESLGIMDIIVNATPLGMEGIKEDLDVPSSLIGKETTAIDLVYNPPKTKFLKIAENLGAKTLNGIKMLVYQGAESFKIWTGIEPPVEIMEEAIKGYL
ncbi:MAG: shikimate dehydrogenase [bacterium]|nr:shikimate dehydrogenase [bacterium]